MVDFFKYARLQNEQRIYLTLSIPLWIFKFSLTNGYIPKCNNIVFYSGKGASPMMHFIFNLQLDKKSRLPKYVDPNLFDTIPLNCIQFVENGQLVDECHSLGFPILDKQSIYLS